MSIETGEVRAAVERAQRIDVVRKVERDAPAQDFGQRNQGDKRDRKSPSALADQEPPHDIIEVSSSHPAEETANARRLPSPPVPTQTAPERHIDIEV